MSTKQLEKILDLYEGDVQSLVSDIEKIASTRSASKAKSSSKKRVYGEPIIAMKDISRSYKQGGTRVDALKGLSVTIYEGEFVSIVGPSGSGKSTLLNIIAGLDRPTTGSAVVASQDLTKLSQGQLSKYRNSTLGFVFQFFYLQPFLTIRKNIEVPLMFSKQGSRNGRKSLSDESLVSVGLADRADFLPSQISGGQMQRVAIARALINKPRIILADEPTGNLDRENSNNIMDLFDTIRDQHKATLIVVTHDENVAARADRIIKMEDGAIV